MLKLHKAFTMIEVIMALGIVAIISTLLISMYKSVPTFRLEAYNQKYCELLDSAVTSAAAERHMSTIKKTDLQGLVPYLKGELSEDFLTITMSDGTEITGSNTTYLATFPNGIGSKLYTITNENGLDCVTGADPSSSNSGSGSGSGSGVLLGGVGDKDSGSDIDKDSEEDSGSDSGRERDSEEGSGSGSSRD